MTIDPQLATTLFEVADAGRWGVSRAMFVQALQASAEKRFGDGPVSPDALATYLRTLHLQDLALACACAAGHERAWQHFVGAYRAVLVRAADAITRNEGGQELADSLHAELFGVTARGAARPSLFRYFHGRSSLATWLRALLAQRHVDRVRERRRADPLPEEDSPAALASPAREAEPDRVRFILAMRAALGAALMGLSSGDRLRLACYYAQHMTLAQVGRLLGEHESTVSRHLERTRTALRDTIERHLLEEQHLGADEVRACFESLAQDAGPLDLHDLLRPDAAAAATGMLARKNAPADRSTEESPA